MTAVSTAIEGADQVNSAAAILAAIRDRLEGALQQAVRAKDMDDTAAGKFLDAAQMARGGGGTGGELATQAESLSKKVDGVTWIIEQALGRIDAHIGQSSSVETDARKWARSLAGGGST